MNGAPEHAWVGAYTTASGMPDPRLVGVTAKPRPCGGCGVLVLAGYDAPLCAGLAIVDPYLIDSPREAAAVLLRVPTYRLWGAAPNLELTPRHHPDVPAHGVAAPADRVSVVMAHRCGYPPISRTPIPWAHKRTVQHSVIPY